jgi:hypothetical protein
MRSQLLTILSPRIKVVLNRNRASNALARPHTPKLLECRRSIDGRLVRAGGLKDVVGTAVRGNGALLLSSRRGVVRAVGLNDVVLDERVACPAVEGDVRVYVSGVPGSGVVYNTVRAGVPLVIVLVIV